MCKYLNSAHLKLNDTILRRKFIMYFHFAFIIIQFEENGRHPMTLAAVPLSPGTGIYHIRTTNRRGVVNYNVAN